MNPAPNIDVETSLLATYGWRPWAEATHLLGAAKAAWLAPSGIARRSGGAWPTRMPLTTRIHAWDEALWLQWRLVPRPTCGTVLVTCLSREGTALPGVPRTRHVAASVQPGREWDRTWIRESATVMFLRPARGRTEDQPR